MSIDNRLRANMYMVNTTGRPIFHNARFSRILPSPLISDTRILTISCLLVHLRRPADRQHSCCHNTESSRLGPPALRHNRTSLIPESTPKPYRSPGTSSTHLSVAVDHFSCPRDVLGNQDRRWSDVAKESARSRRRVSCFVQHAFPTGFLSQLLVVP